MEHERLIPGNIRRQMYIQAACMLLNGAVNKNYPAIVKAAEELWKADVASGVWTKEEA
jgi:hypothetical protein